MAHHNAINHIYAHTFCPPLKGGCTLSPLTMPTKRMEYGSLTAALHIRFTLRPTG